MDKLVYVILINYNTRNHTMECIESLNKLSYKNYRILIIDNNSKNDNFDDIKLKYSNVDLIYNDRNVGFSGANNIGIKYALENYADYILLLNNDTIVEENFLDILVEKSEKNKEVGICTGRINSYYEKNRIWYAGGDINYLKGDTKVYGFDANSDTYIDEERYCEFASGCCMLLKAEALKKVGLMNEEYFLYYEDVDYSKSYLDNGFKILYCPDSVIYHKESVSTRKYSYNYQYYFTRNRLLFVKNNFKFLNKITAYPISILWLLYKILKGTFNFKPCIEGIKDFIFRRFGKRG